VSRASLPPVAAPLREPREGNAAQEVVDWVTLEPKVEGRALAPASLLVALGGGALALVLPHTDAGSSLHTWVLLLGMLLITSGPLWVLVQPVYGTRRDAYLAFRLDGLAVRVEGASAATLLPWEDIDEVHSQENEDAVHVVCAAGAVITLHGPFEDATAHEVAARIRKARRLAVWNRLKPGAR
jgi:hypothetical protein